MGRPRSTDPRDKTLTVQLSSAERESLVLDACRLDRSLSGYARDILLDRPPPVIVPELNRKYWLELARVASNLNQVAHHLNSGKLISSDAILNVVEHVGDAVSALREELLGARK